MIGAKLCTAHRAERARRLAKIPRGINGVVDLGVDHRDGRTRFGNQHLGEAIARSGDAQRKARHPGAAVDSAQFSPGLARRKQRVNRRRRTLAPLRRLADRTNADVAAPGPRKQPAHPLAIAVAARVGDRLVREARLRDHGNAQRRARHLERDRTGVRTRQAEHRGSQAARLEAVRLGRRAVEDHGVTGVFAPLSLSLLHATTLRRGCRGLRQHLAQPLRAERQLARVAREQGPRMRQRRVGIGGFGGERDQILNCTRELLRVHERLPAAHCEPVVGDDPLEPGRDPGSQLQRRCRSAELFGKHRGSREQVRVFARDHGAHCWARFEQWHERSHLLGLLRRTFVEWRDCDATENRLDLLASSEACDTDNHLQRCAARVDARASECGQRRGRLQRFGQLGGEAHAYPQPVEAGCLQCGHEQLRGKQRAAVVMRFDEDRHVVSLRGLEQGAQPLRTHGSVVVERPGAGAGARHEA